MALNTRPLGTSPIEITTVGFGAWAVGGGGWSHGWGPQDDAASIAVTALISMSRFGPMFDAYSAAAPAVGDHATRSRDRRRLCQQ